MSAPFRKSASPAAIATEVTSLRWLAETMPSGGADVAELVDSGPDWLATRMLPTRSPSARACREFGRRLAMTHAGGAGWFGAPPPGLPVEQAVLAELPSPALDKAEYTSWGHFFAELRLLPYLEMAQAAGSFDKQENRHLLRLIHRVSDGEFDADQPAAVRSAHRSAAEMHDQLPAVARNHGDLWGGNVVWADTIDGVVGTLIDPSAHGGHAETDLAELALFGSPHLGEILAGYQAVSPLADGWRERVPIHQLHMLLVHVVLFGGGYVSEVAQLARSLA